MIEHNQLKDLIIKPVLDKMGFYSDFAVELLLFTCAAETNGGSYLKQINGPALGIYQCEPATHEDIWRNYLVFHPVMIQRIALQFGIARQPSEDRLIWDLYYQTLVARLHYYRVKYPLPKEITTDNLWDYYKEHYNTKKGKATKEKAVEAYLKFKGEDVQITRKSRNKNTKAGSTRNQD